MVQNSQQAPIPALAFLFVAVASALFLAQGAVQYFSIALFREELVVPPQVTLIVAAFALTVLLSRQPAVFLRERLLTGSAMAVIVLGILNSDPDAARADQLKGPFQIVVGLLSFYLWFHVARSESRLRMLFQVLMVVSILSDGIAVFEALTSHAVPWSKGQYVSLASGDGAQGLEWFPVSFAYSVLLPAGLAVAYVAAAPGSYAHPGRSLCLATIVGALFGLAAAASRSGVLAVLLSFLVLALMKGRLRLSTLVKISAVILPVVALAFSLAFHVIEKANPLEDIRLYGTYALYLPVIAVNPFGLDPESMQDVRTIIRAHEDLGLNLPTEVFERAIEIAPHNGFLTAGIRYGWIGLGCLLIIYAGAVRYSRVGMRAFRQTPLEPLILAATCAVFAVFVHSMFHNASLIVGEMRNWAPLGILASIAGVARARAGNERNRRAGVF